MYSAEMCRNSAVIYMYDRIIITAISVCSGTVVISIQLSLKNTT